MGRALTLACNLLLKKERNQKKLLRIASVLKIYEFSKFTFICAAGTPIELLAVLFPLLLLLF